MPKVICKLENASDLIGGVRFVQHRDGMVSEEISEDQAERFLSIPGYELHVAKATDTTKLGEGTAAGAGENKPGNRGGKSNAGKGANKGEASGDAGKGAAIAPGGEVGAAGAGEVAAATGAAAGATESGSEGSAEQK